MIKRLFVAESCAEIDDDDAMKSCQSRPALMQHVNEILSHHPHSSLKTSTSPVQPHYHLRYRCCCCCC